MSRQMIPVEEAFAEWRKDPEYVKAYNALADEFSLAAMIIRARTHAGLTQEQLAERMHTTQAVIARLESGRVKPSTRTLERLAAATGMRLRISFEPAPAK
jgi:ribosome-binding protein aMBF1 (putative translation factor)